MDGVITDGKMTYDKNGKKFKIFGPDDNDSLKVLKKYIKIYFVSGDKKGFNISKKRVNDMGFKISYVPAMQRERWLEKKFGLNRCVYMGDGIFDHLVMRKALFAIAPRNSLDHVLASADFITNRNSGDRAVAEAAIHLLKFYFKIDIAKIKKL